MNFEKRIYTQEFSLNDTDDSIIEFIRKNRQDIQNISIHRMADYLCVSPNAIIRAAKKLGYSGFSELKFSLQKENDPEDPITAEHQVLKRLPQNIVKSLDVLDEKALQKLLEEMEAADKILFAGIGDSVYFCELFGRSLRCLDKKVEYYQQIHDIEYAAKHCTSNDLIVVVSASGTPPRLVKLAENARERSIKVFCITHYGKNPLSSVSDDQLCFWGEKNMVNGYNMTDRSGLMMLIRLICEEYWKKYGGLSVE